MRFNRLKFLHEICSPADEAGLTRGDTILRCGTTTIHNLDDWQRILAASGRGSALVLRVRKADSGDAAIMVLRTES